MDMTSMNIYIYVGEKLFLILFTDPIDFRSQMVYTIGVERRKGER